MQASDIPVKIPTPFGTSAGGGFIRTVPIPSQIGIQDGAASFTTGFVPLNFLPIGAGGVPPFGADFNGLFNQISAWNRWQGAGGAVLYDNAFQAAVGGYPLGAIIMSATNPGVLWISLAENNLTNPDTGGANWAVFSNNGNRIIASNATQTLTAFDYAVGFNRTAPPAVQIVNLCPTPPPRMLQIIEDLAGNVAPGALLRITPPGGHPIAGLPSFDMVVARGSRGFRFYGSNFWSLAGA